MGSEPQNGNLEVFCDRLFWYKPFQQQIYIKYSQPYPLISFTLCFFKGQLLGSYFCVFGYDNIVFTKFTAEMEMQKHY